MHDIGVLYKKKPRCPPDTRELVFDCQLNKLCDDNKLMTGKGKEVDTNYPLLPVLMPRGYRGVACYRVV